jgi:hypothetical protein
VPQHPGVSLQVQTHRKDSQARRQKSQIGENHGVRIKISRPSRQTQQDQELNHINELQWLQWPQEECLWINHDQTHWLEEDHQEHLDQVQWGKHITIQVLVDGSYKFFRKVVTMLGLRYDSSKMETISIEDWAAQCLDTRPADSCCWSNPTIFITLTYHPFSD